MVIHFSAYFGSSQLKKEWCLYGVTGGSGTGKTRFSMCVQEHILKELEKSDYSNDVSIEGEGKETILNSLKNSLKRNIVIKTDFSNGDYFREWEDPELMVKSILITLLSKSFLPAQKIQSILSKFTYWKDISIESAASVLHNFYKIPEGEHLTIFFVVDEFQIKVSEEDLKILRAKADRENIFIRKLSYTIMDLCQRLKDSNIFLVPIFCGTFSIRYLNIFPVTQYTMINFPIGPLEPEDSFQILQDLKIDLPKSLIETTGNIPRALQYLVMAYNDVDNKKDFQKIYMNARKILQDYYPSKFSESSFSKLLFTRLLEYCLVGKIILNEEEKIENTPIGILKRDGLIFYKPLSKKEKEELTQHGKWNAKTAEIDGQPFRILLPLMFADIFSVNVGIFNSNILTYRYDTSYQEYEQFSRDFKVFKNNFFFKTLKISETTCGKLFYGAIMSEERRNQKIKLTEMAVSTTTTYDFPQDSKIKVIHRNDSVDVSKESYGIWIGRNCTVADSIFSYPNQSNNKILICLEELKSTFVYHKVEDDKIRTNEILKECEDAGLVPESPKNKKNHFNDEKYDLMLHLITNMRVPSLKTMKKINNPVKQEEKNLNLLINLINTGKLMIVSIVFFLFFLFFFLKKYNF